MERVAVIIEEKLTVNRNVVDKKWILINWLSI